MNKNAKKSEFLSNLGQNLRAIRNEIGISTEVIAEVLDKSPRSIVYACKGATLLSMTDIYRISFVCRISIDSLLLTTLSKKDIGIAAKNLRNEYLSIQQNKTFYDRAKTKEALLDTLRQNLLLLSNIEKDTAFIDEFTTREAYRKSYERTVSFKNKDILNAVNVYIIANSFNLTIDDLCHEKKGHFLHGRLQQNII